MKRVREPLADTNRVMADALCETSRTRPVWGVRGSWGLLTFSVWSLAPQLSSKPSPSKRRCSEENLQPAADEENQEPVKAWAAGPSTDRTPPVDPASVQPSSSEKTVAQLNTARPEPEQMPVSPGPNGPSSRAAPTGSSLQKNPVDHGAPGAAGMKSRLQKLAEQRKCWDGESGPNLSASQ